MSEETKNHDEVTTTISMKKLVGLLTKFYEPSSDAYELDQKIRTVIDYLLANVHEEWIFTGEEGDVWRRIYKKANGRYELFVEFAQGADDTQHSLTGRPELIRKHGEFVVKEEFDLSVRPLSAISVDKEDIGSLLRMWKEG